MPIQHAETRRHELRKCRMMMIDGRLTLNQRSVDGGHSARVMCDGYWGFAAAPGEPSARTRDQALANARAMSGFGPRPGVALPGGVYRGGHPIAAAAPLTVAEATERMAALDALCRRIEPALRSVRVVLSDEYHAKHVASEAGADAHSFIHRAVCHLVVVGEGEQGQPVELWEQLSTKGGLAELDLGEAAMQPRVEQLAAHLRAKCRAVPARGGVHTVVMAPVLAGMLAHEAMGHPCEADAVLGGAVTADLLGRRVASDAVTMVDFAHTVLGQEALVPVYADDEGTPARDAVLIERGLLAGYMSDRDTARRLGLQPSGNARAYGPADEPLIRMRNTAILPGTDRLDDMIAGVDDGYLLLKTGNGQADTTTEFMFGITLGYEIRQGRIGRAIRDTTVSGTAIDMLQTVDAVSDEMAWSVAGYCGKKQPMVVSMGGPALRARLHLGGQ